MPLESLQRRIGPQKIVLIQYASTTFNRESKYRSRALKRRFKLRAAIGLRAAFGNFLLHQNLSLCTVTFGEKVLALAKSRGS